MTRFLAIVILLVTIAARAAVPGQAELLEEIQRRGVEFFIYEAHPKTGLVKDRAGNVHGDDYHVASVASTGFGLAVLAVVAAEHGGWLPRDEARARVERTLKFAWEKLPNEHGWFYHFVDWKTGERAWDSEVSSIDTGLFLAGALAAGEYFGGEAKELAARIYRRTDFQWMLTNGGERPDELLLAHGWKPESGFLKPRWDTYSEHLVLNLLALGSPGTPIPDKAWDAWRRNLVEVGGARTFATGPLFVHQYSHAFVDFRGRKDRGGINYWETAVIATRANRDFCIEHASKFTSYGRNSWGISATDSPDSYRAFAAPPARPRHDGTLAPWAVAAAVPFLAEAKDALSHWRLTQPQLWGRYGFSSGFNLDRDWFSNDVIGIDVGAAVLLLENERSGFVWRIFMGIPELQIALRKAGFTPTK